MDALSEVHWKCQNVRYLILETYQKPVYLGIFQMEYQWKGNLQDMKYSENWKFSLFQLNIADIANVEIHKRANTLKIAKVKV